MRPFAAVQVGGDVRLSGFGATVGAGATVLVGESSEGMPEVETLSQHLFSSVRWSVASKDGYSFTSVSPLGPELLIGTAVIGLGVALLWTSDVARSTPPPEAKPTERKGAKKESE